jgi:TatD DNase family protein
MVFTDTHTHLYLNAFDKDRNEVVNNAIDTGIKYMLLPNIDSGSVNGMLELCMQFPGSCFPMMGLHPTSVKDNYLKELELVRSWHEKTRFYAVGEIGIDLYWDTTRLIEQEDAFRQQIQLAKSLGLPIVIHTRNSFNEIFRILDELYEPGLKGVFHCFTGNLEQADKIRSWGFKLGIGGVVTFKNSGLDRVIPDIALEDIILETDSPFLAPLPYRGKRNESSYIKYIAEKLASLKGVELEEVASVTTANARELFQF